MATNVSLHTRVYVGHLDLADHCETVDFGQLTKEAVPFTNFGSGGYQEMRPGLASATFTAGLFQDFAADVLDDELGVDALGGQYAITVAPNESGTETAGDPCWFTRGILGQYNPLTGQRGDAAKAAVSVPYDTVFLRGLVGHPKAARTSDGNGTAVALTGPSASQRLFGVLHVIAYSGLTNIVVKVQSDDGSGMASPTDRLTFATVNAVGSQFVAVAGGWATETHHRITWDVTGTGSCTFYAAFGVL